MKCSICGNKACAEVNLHADGFVQNLQECGVCGTLWTIKGGGTILVVATTVGTGVT